MPLPSDSFLSLLIQLYRILAIDIVCQKHRRSSCHPASRHSSTCTLAGSPCLWENKNDNRRLQILNKILLPVLCFRHFRQEYLAYWVILNICNLSHNVWLWFCIRGSIDSLPIFVLWVCRNCELNCFVESVSFDKMSAIVKSATDTDSCCISSVLSLRWGNVGFA